MTQGVSVLERKALQAGKVFITQGEENIRAYVIQDGEVAAFTKDGDKKVEVGRFGPGTIIGEINLMIDDPASLSYETITMTTVVTITRQDFQKRLARADKSITTILEHAVQKIKFFEDIETRKAIERMNVDDMALHLVRNLVMNLSVDKKMQYEDAILPHINGMIRDIKNIKKDEKARRKAEAEKTAAE